MKHHRILLLLALATILASGGATCNYRIRSADPVAPAAFVGPPTLEEVIYAVNANTRRVGQLQTDSAWLSAPGLPALRASIAMERPRRFRLRGRLVGPEIDVGSNDEFFWLWSKSNPEPAVYFARHDQFASSRAHSMLPIEADWLIEAFGLVSLDTADVHQGPYPAGDGAIEIRSISSRLTGNLTRSIVIDDTYGWVLEEQVRDASGQQLAWVRCRQHRFYPLAGASLPHRVEIELPPAQIAFRVDVTQYVVNQLYGTPEQLWSMPQLEGHRFINLADGPGSTANRLPLVPGASPSLPSYESTIAYRPRYRGYSQSR